MRKPRVSRKTFSPEENAALSDALIRLRDERGWTQTQAAEALGVTQGRISALERGDGFGPGFARVVADRLGTTVGDIIGFPGPSSEGGPTDPYPNRGIAVRCGKMLKVSAAAIADLERRTLRPGEEDPPAKWWMRKLLALDEANEGPLAT